MRLVLTHVRYGLLETLRIPIMVVSVTALPALSFLFFALPNVSDDPVGATASTASLAVFAAMLICLFQFGVGMAEDRQSPWDPYLRTLPVRPWQRVAGRILVALPFMIVAIIPLLLIAWATTNATASPARLGLGIGALVLGALPLALIGIALGNALPSKAAIAVANVLLLPLAFLGGLFIPPEFLPEVVQRVSPFLPTRGWLELVYGAVLGDGASDVNTTAVVAWGGWVMIAAALALLAYRRAETKSYR